MDNLKKIRDEMLSLHKTLMDIQRANYEANFGKVTNMQLLNLLFDNEEFVWLREISTLVSEIDEFFAAKEGVNEQLRSDLLNKSKSLFEDNAENSSFMRRFLSILSTERSVREHNERLKNLFGEVSN